MKSTIVPAQITTIEDRFSGNLSLQQILLLSSSVFIGFAIYVFLPPFLKLDSYKIVLMILMFFIISITAVRIKGKLVLFWIITILNYNRRSQYCLLYTSKSGKEPEIATTYGKCFDGSETIGDMLANGDIVRKSNGDIVPDQGLCSPKNLGTANTKYHDLVFRWRVAQGYKNSLDQLSQTQDVTGSAATPPTSPQPTPTPSQNTQCTADFSAAPDLAPVAKNLVAACEQNFPKTETLLSPSLYPAPHNMIFVPSSSIPHGDPAATNKGTVHLNISYFRQHPTDVGVIVHEDTHVIQGYGSKFYTPQAPFWIVEGMADWVRNKLGYTDPANYHCGSGQTYLSGYNCGAVFLDYLSSYDSNFVQDAHNAIRQGGYSDTTFILQKTGSDLKTLYNKCLQSNCAGGSGL